MKRFSLLVALGIWWIAAAWQPVAAAESSSADQGAAAEVSTDEAVKTAETWLALIDAAKYDESWSGAANYFRGAVKKRQWIASLEADRTPLGAVVSRMERSVLQATTLPGAPDGDYVIVRYETTFANKRTAIETVTPMRDKDGTWRVAGYYIR